MHLFLRHAHDSFPAGQCPWAVTGKGGQILRAAVAVRAAYTAIKTTHFSDEWEQTAVPFEESLTEEQIIVFHKFCDLQSETSAAEMRAAYKVGFKDGVALMREVQE